jgi:signal transduction histidine kinase
MVQPAMKDRTRRRWLSRWLRPTERPLAYLMPGAIVTLCLLGALGIDYLAPWPYVMTPLYAVPVLVATHSLPTRGVAIVGVLATVVNVVSSTLQGTPLVIVVLYSFGLVLTAYLAVLLAIERGRANRHAQQAEEAREQLQEFISLVAHELRNPLTALRGHAQRFRRAELGPRQMEQSALVIEHTTQRLGRLVNDLLDTTQFSAGRFQTHPVQTDLAELAHEVVALQQPTTGQHRLILECPDRVDGDWDGERISQVLANLVSNALKYSPEGGDVRVQVRTTDADVTVCVSDQGPGIAPEQKQRLFQPFTRLIETAAAPGLGVGLYLARGIVEAHGGRIWVDSQPGAGSTFCFNLPRRSDDPAGQVSVLDPAQT